MEMHEAIIKPFRRFLYAALVAAALLSVAFTSLSLQGGLQTAAAPSRPAHAASFSWSPQASGLFFSYPPSTHQPLYTGIHGSSIRDVSKQCPPWFWEYAAFHNTHRGRPDTKCLVVQDGPYGLGDRLNGALSMLRLAKALDRVLLLRWNSPYPLEEFFEPAGILNWTTRGIAIEDGPKVSFVNRNRWNDSQLHDGSLQNVNDTFLTITTNMELHRPCYGCPEMPSSEWSKEAACLWQNMFRPVEPILQQAKAQLQQLYPKGLRPYVAVHLRLGGLKGEGSPGPDRGKAPFDNLLAGVRCVSRLAANSSINLDRTPALVVTDNHSLRQMLQEQHFRRVVTPPGLPVHIRVDSKKQSLESHRSTVVDMVLLAWSECMATSRSGFSLHAWLYSGAKPCMTPWTTCL